MELRWIIRLALVAACVGVYGQGLGFEFVSYDDPMYVFEQPLVRSGLTLPGVLWAATSLEISNWHPVTWLSHMLDCTLFGLKPAGHHLTSLVLHAATSVLLFNWLARSTGAVWRSALVAALFALHPLHVESVAWVAERKDLLCGFFGLLAIGSYDAYARQPRLASYLLVGLWLALGLASKAMLITLPFVFLLLDHWPLGRSAPLRRRLLEKLPFLALALGAGAATFHAQRQYGSLASEIALPLGLRLQHAAVSYVWYAAKLVWPSDLGILYPHPYLAGGAGWATWQVIGSIGLLLVVSAAVLLGRRRGYAIVGWGWFLGMLVPVIGLVQASVQGMADRYSYLPSIGLFILLVWGGAEIAARLHSFWLKRALAAAAVLALAALAATAWLQARNWHDSVALYERSQQVTGGRSQVHANLGAALRAQRRIGEAISVYQRGVLLYPGHAVLHLNFGNALRDQKRGSEAIEQYRLAIAAKPDAAMAHAYLALAHAERKELEPAVAAAREAVRLGPDLALAHKILADILRAQGRFGEASAEYEQSLRLQPDFPEARAGLAASLRRR